MSSADVSLNDSNLTTQSNVTYKCSEAECDSEPKDKDSTIGKKLKKDTSVFLLLEKLLLQRFIIPLQRPKFYIQGWEYDLYFRLLSSLQYSFN